MHVCYVHNYVLESFFILLHLTSSFADVIVTMATRGRHLTLNITLRMSCSKLLSQKTFMVVISGEDVI